ncbi:anti-sigma factor RsrA [Streptomyces badius]
MSPAPGRPEQAVKKLVKRCCGNYHVPTDLRSKVMGLDRSIRACEAVPDQDVTVQDTDRSATAAE